MSKSTFSGPVNSTNGFKINDVQVPVSVSIAYAASATTDGIEATLTVVDGLGSVVSGVHNLEVYISDDTAGAALTSTAASGALTATVGSILSVHTAKKHVSLNTAASGIATLKLVDSANTADEHVCVKHPMSGRVIVGSATVAGDYEGG